MKLYLSSIHIPNEQDFAELFSPAKTHRLALITNAWDVAPGEKSAPYISGTRQQLEQIAGTSFAPEPFDLRRYIGKTEELTQALGSYSGVWITGGNSFYLNWLLHRCDFGGALKPLWAHGFVYGGESAGAAVAGSTLHGIEFLDDPKEDPATETIWDGLRLLDYGIIPHWGEPKYESYLTKTKTEMERYYKVRTITKDEYIVVDNSAR